MNVHYFIIMVSILKAHPFFVREAEALWRGRRSSELGETSVVIRLSANYSGGVGGKEPGVSRGSC